jgi:DNA-binding winged helix-turn-helix (wHTH) protein
MIARLVPCDCFHGRRQQGPWRRAGEGRTTDTLTARYQRLGSCLLDIGRGLLQQADGTETMLRPKSLELLLFLLRNRGRVVGRAEILDTVGPRVVVSEDSVTQCIVDFRKAFGPSGLDLLQTVPRRGYLLEAGPEAAATTRLQAEGRPSVTVLPFRKDYADPDEASFADGLIEGIVHVLSASSRSLSCRAVPSWRWRKQLWRHAPSAGNSA